MPQAPSIHIPEPLCQQHNKRHLADSKEEPGRKKFKPNEIQLKSRLESLPAEIFCHVLSFVGPTSSSLVALTELNKNMNRTMNAIGGAMLKRARSNFRIPLEPLSPVESCTSLFVRHARTGSAILNKLALLRKLLGSIASVQAPGDGHVAIMDKAMAMALSLLEVSPTLSVSLERHILSTCGKCGGLAFKSSKSKVMATTTHVQVLDESAAVETSVAEHADQQSRRKHEERLDMARLIMQIVVFRDLQNSKQSPSNLTNLVQNHQQTATKKSFAMGCV